jgi:hypothetical protein
VFAYILTLIAITLIISYKFHVSLFKIDSVMTVIVIVLQIVWMMSLPLCNLLFLCLVSLALKARFAKLNQLAMTGNEDIRAVAGLHLMLVDVVRAVNGIYGLMLPTFLASSLMQSTFAAYEIFGIFVTGEEGIDGKRVGFAMLLTCHNVFLISVLIVSVHFTSVAVGESGASLEICCRMRKRMKMMKNFGVFGRQLVHTSETVFSCGMYNYDWTLVFNYVTSIVSYLVVVLQFDTSLMG